MQGIVLYWKQMKPDKPKEGARVSCTQMGKWSCTDLQEKDITDKQEISDIT